eukprot:NODE_64_length_26047_cov_1.706837.p17 type:complete len:112 gc:universal NODE_64_length_26047_cov_1.706837:10339-10004(-)
MPLQNAIEFFDKLPISGKSALEILKRKNICDVEDMIFHNRETKKFTHKRSFDIMRIFKSSIEEAYKDVNFYSQQNSQYLTKLSTSVIPTKSYSCVIFIPLKCYTVSTLINL